MLRVYLTTGSPASVPENVGTLSPSPLTLTQHLGAPHLITHDLQTPTGKLHLLLPWETQTQDIQN